MSEPGANLTHQAKLLQLPNSARGCNLTRRLADAFPQVLFLVELIDLSSFEIPA